MALPGIPLAPGKGRGTVHLVEDPLDWCGGARGPLVLALPGIWWPPRDVDLGEVAGFAVHGIPGFADEEPQAPAVAGLDRDLFREGELAEVDGDAGEVFLEGVQEVPVVTSFLQRGDGRLLLLRRSERVGSFPRRWAAVSGYLESAPPLEQAFREIEEETGLVREDLTLVVEGPPVLAREANRIYLVHPFRFEVRRDQVRLDWEHTECEWVEASELGRRPTVPKLDRAWEAVAPVPTRKS